MRDSSLAVQDFACGFTLNYASLTPPKSAQLCGLPQFNRIALRVMQPSEAPDLAISFRGFDLNACSSQLGHHFVHVMHSKVNHPVLARIAEIFGRLGKGSEYGRSGLLLPNASALAGR